VNALYEFLFCPMHGLLRPDNLALLLPGIYGGVAFMKTYWCKLTGMVK
jgi:hypothetical protein